MTITFEVSKDRLYSEWQKYCQNDMKKNAEWHVDKAGVLHVYVFSDHEAAYHHALPSKQSRTLPLELLQEIRSRKGETLGIKDPTPLSTNSPERTVDILRRENPALQKLNKT